MNGLLRITPAHGLGQESDHEALLADIPTLAHGVAIGSAVGLALVDLVFVARRRIAPVYLADAAAETALLFAWGTARE